MHTRWFQFIHLQWKTTTIQCFFGLFGWIWGPNCSVHLKSNCYSDCLWYCIVSIRKRKKTKMKKLLGNSSNPVTFLCGCYNAFAKNFNRQINTILKWMFCLACFFMRFHLPRNHERKKKIQNDCLFRLQKIKQYQTECKHVCIFFHSSSLVHSFDDNCFIW